MEHQETYKDYTLLIIRMDAGIAGTDCHDAYIAHPGDTVLGAEQDAWLMGVQHAESYGIYPECDRDEDEDEDEDSYSNNIEGYIDGEYTKETADRYDGLRRYGGSFATDFIFQLRDMDAPVPAWLLEYAESL